MVEGSLLAPSPLGTVAACVLALLALLVLPLRNQGGEHGGAGPGATDVWQLANVLAGTSDDAHSSPEPRWPDEADNAAAIAAEERAAVSLERRRLRKLRAEPVAYEGRHRLIEVPEFVPTAPVALSPTALRCVC